MESKKDLQDFHNCDFCPYGTKLLSTILQHTEQHRRKLQGHVDAFTCHNNISEIHKCENCDFVTNLKVSLTQHTNQNHKGLKTQNQFISVMRRCRYCDYQTYSVLLQLKHCLVCEERENSRNNWLECGHCPYKTQNNRFYLIEQMKKLRATLLTILQSEKSLHPKYERHLRRYVSYIKDTNLKDHKWFKCDKCLFKSQWRDSLQRHVSVEHFVILNCFESSDCEFKSKSRFSLKMHILDQHIYSPSEKRLQCDTCAYKAKCKFLLKRHFRLNHPMCENNNNQSLQCENISKWKTILKRRLKDNQKNIVWYQCSYCRLRLKSKYLLQQHIITNHTERANCEYKTKSASPLDKHSADSEKVVWYPCDKCKYKTECKKFLEEHRAQIHTNQADTIWYQCDKCTYKAQSHVCLNRHINCEHVKTLK